MDEDAGRLEKRISATRRNARGRREYASALKRDVLEFVERGKTAGLSENKMCTMLGLHQATLSGWLGRKQRTASSTKERSKVRRVEVDEAVVANPVVVLAGGARIEGLSWPQLVALAREL